MIYMYESHLGGIYFSNMNYSYDELYCETCGDSDWNLGEVETWDDVLERVTDEDGFVMYYEDYLEEKKKEFEAYECRN